jgi:hypothetical protein
MNTKQTFVYFLGMFALTFVVSAIVTFLYSLIVHGAGVVDWETAFRFAIIFGIIFTWEKRKRRNKG